MSRWQICIMRMDIQRQGMVDRGIQVMVGLDMGVVATGVPMLEDMEMPMEDTLVLLGHTLLLSIIWHQLRTHIKYQEQSVNQRDSRIRQIEASRKIESKLTASELIAITRRRKTRSRLRLIIQLVETNR